MEILISPLAVVPFVVGATSHVAYFNRGEHHLHGGRYIQLGLCGLLLMGLGFYRLGCDLREASLLSAVFGAEFLGGLFSSLIIYRVFLHPLNKFPGPLSYRISCFAFSFGLSKGDAYVKLKELHDKHGDFVRIGSSDLSITHPKAVQAIYGQTSECTKAAWYDLTQPMVSLQTYRTRALHDQRRRVWSNSFSDRALRGYEERIQKYRNKLFSQIDAFGGRPVNVSKWFNLFSFDVMGDLAFGSPFGMLDTSEEHWAIKLLNEGIAPLQWMFPVWFFRVMTAIPGLTRDWWRFIDYCAARAKERRQNPPKTPDIMSNLLAPLGGKEPEGSALDLLNGDAQLIVVAGSDTTAVTLTHIMLELCRQPEHIDKLRAEVEPHMNGDEVLHSSIFNLEHLNGVIWETLRLHPPVPSALQRVTPPQGLQVGEHYIPGNMTVYCPQYAIGRKEEVYTHAEAFVPERWYLYPDMVKDSSAWAPFSAGRYGCIGKPLALLNIRTTVARIVMRYDIKFARADNGRSCELRAKEHFTLAPGELEICFTKRKA